MRERQTCETCAAHFLRSQIAVSQSIFVCFMSEGLNLLALRWNWIKKKKEILFMSNAVRRVVKKWKMHTKYSIKGICLKGRGGVRVFRGLLKKLSGNFWKLWEKLKKFWSFEENFDEFLNFKFNGWWEFENYVECVSRSL